MTTTSQPIDTQPSPPRFRLWQLFALIAMVAVVLAIARWSVSAGILAGFVVFAIAAWRCRQIKTVVEFGVLIGIGVVLAAIVMPPLEEGRGGARLRISKDHVRQIMLAMHQYQQDYGTFPPAYTVDANGQPLHSWRVLLLPYLEENSLYEQFHLEEPWDSPANLQVAATTPMIYRSYHRRSTAPTSFVLLTGDGTMWPNREALDEAEIANPQTIAVIEWPGADVAWTEPTDVDMSEFWRLTHPAAGQADSHLRHINGEVVLGLANGESIALPLHKLAPKQLRALLHQHETAEDDP